MSSGSRNAFRKLPNYTDITSVGKLQLGKLNLVFVAGIVCTVVFVFVYACTFVPASLSARIAGRTICGAASAWCAFALQSGMAFRNVDGWPFYFGLCLGALVIARPFSLVNDAQLWRAKRARAPKRAAQLQARALAKMVGPSNSANQTAA